MKLLPGAAALAAAAAISLAACGGGSTTLAPAPTSPAAPTSVPTVTPTVSPTGTPGPTASPTESPTASPTATPTPSTVLLTTADKSVVPVFVCIADLSATNFAIRFSYDNTNAFAVEVPIGSLDGSTQLNQITVTTRGGSVTEFTGQPSIFESGASTQTFDVPAGASDTVTWNLTGNVYTANTSGPRCTS